MKEILEEYLRNGCKITRSRGKNPNLLIIGEEHFFNTYVTPKELFSEVKPKYFFCEGVRSGLQMGLTEYQATRVDISTPARGESFEKFIWGALYDRGVGFAGVAMTKWFSLSPETTFVGIDLAGGTSKDDQIVQLGVEAIMELDGYVTEMLDFHANKLTVKQYSCYEFFHDFLYANTASSPTAYDTQRKLEEIRKTAPRNVLSRSDARHLFTRVKKETERFNMDREEMMGRTLVEYVSEADGISIAIVGVHHIRTKSGIFPILDGSSVEYLAVDIAKPNVK